MTLSNGTIVLVDDALGKIFIGNSHDTAEVSLNAVLLEVANGDPAKAAELRQQLKATVARPDMVTSLTQQPSISTSSFGYPSNNMQMLPPGGFGSSFHCSYWVSCRDEYIPTGGGFGFRFWDTLNPSDARGPDYDYWQRRRMDQCDSMNDSFMDAGLTTGLSVACGLAATGIGAVGCAVGVVVVIFQMNRAAEAAKECYAEYPGPGNW